VPAVDSIDGSRRLRRAQSQIRLISGK